MGKFNFSADYEVYSRIVWATKHQEQKLFTKAKEFWDILSLLFCLLNCVLEHFLLRNLLTESSFNVRSAICILLFVQMLVSHNVEPALSRSLSWVIASFQLIKLFNFAFVPTDRERERDRSANNSVSCCVKLLRYNSRCRSMKWT